MKRKVYFISLSACVICLLYTPSNAQNVGISATGIAPDNSAGLDINFTNKGLLIPRVALASSTDAVTIPSPATSLLVYNTGTGGLSPAGYYYNAGTPGSPNWVKLLRTGSPSDAWLTLGNAGTTPGTHFIGTTDNVDLVFKTNNVERMRIKNTGPVTIGTTTPHFHAVLHVHDNIYSPTANHRTGIVVSRYMPGGDGIQGNTGYFLLNTATGGGWMLQYADPDGGYALGGRDLEITEYPNDGSGSPGCCRRRFVIQNSHSLSPWTTGGQLPVTIGNDGKVDAYGFNNISDVSSKENIEDLSYGLNEVLKIRSRFFNYKGIGKRRVGFIAQELRDVIPEVVDSLRDGDRVLLGVDYGEMSAVLVRAIQEQQRIIDAKQEEIDRLKEEMDKLRLGHQEEMRRLRAELQELKSLYSRK